MKSPLLASLVFVSLLLVAPLASANPTMEIDKSGEHPVLVVTPSGQEIKAEVSSVKGRAEYAAPGKTQFSPLKQGQKLPVGSTVRTGKDGEVVLVPMPGTLLNVAPGSQLVISELAFAKKKDEVTLRKGVIDLKEGAVTAALEKLDPKTTDFRVKMPQGVAAARGTVFNIKIENGKATVTVVNGNVSLVSVNGKAVNIAPGQAGTVGSGEDPSTGPADPSVLEESKTDAEQLGSADSAPNTPAAKTLTFTSNPVTDAVVKIDGVEYRIRFGPGSNDGDLIIVLQPKEGQSIQLTGNLPSTEIAMSAGASAVITVNTDTSKVVVENPNRSGSRVSVNGTPVTPSSPIGITPGGTLVTLEPGSVQSFLQSPSGVNPTANPPTTTDIENLANSALSSFAPNLNPAAATPVVPGQ